MEEGTHGLYQRIGKVMAEAIEDHEERCHIPPPRRGRVTAIPFPNVRLNDLQTSKAMEMLNGGSTLEEAAAAIDVPSLALERALAEYRPAWRQFLHEREVAG